MPTPIKSAIEQPEEAVDRPLPPAVAMRRIVRLEQQRAHRRRQRQRDDQRNDGGAGDGQRELPIELPGNAGDEHRRHEYGAKNQRDGDQRRADFVHALARGFARMQARRDIALDVLDHDDGVIDHDADRQHQPEQRQIVEREAERRHEEERADQRYRYGDQRNDRRAPGLQEHDHHQHDEHDRLADGLDHGVDRLLDELGRIEENGVFDPRREPLRQFVHQVFDALGSGQRVRAGALEDGERDRRIVVEIGIRGVIERRQLDLGDVLEPHHRAGRLLDDDRGELVGIGQPPERLHRNLEGARMRDRRLIEHAGGDLDVLPLQRVGDVGRGQPERLQAVGIEPHPHRIVAGAEHDDRADAVDAGHRVGHFERGVIGDEQRVARLVGRIQVHDHHQIGRAFCTVTPILRTSAGSRGCGDGDAVLHLHLRDIEIGAEIEADRDREAPVGGRVRRHVDHVLDAVDLLLHRRDHGRGHDFGAGARILAGDADQSAARSRDIARSAAARTTPRRGSRRRSRSPRQRSAGR